MQPVKEWVKSIGLALLLFLVIRTFLIQAFKIPTGSMENTLLVGDFLLVNKLAYGASTPRQIPLLGMEIPSVRIPGYDTPERGDIVVFEYPLDRSLDYVKRCIALPGDTVEMYDKVLYINGQPQQETYVQHGDPNIQRVRGRSSAGARFSWQRDYLTDEGRRRNGENYTPTRDNFGPIFVPEGHYFCMGDNRDFSSDSRYWGFVPAELIEGRPVILYFSWNRRRFMPRFDRIGAIIN
jgi:signal peptidase I